ncbi:MAG: hypothetical protein Kow006_04480 [Gammaproteobacteria bacterium]
MPKAHIPFVLILALTTPVQGQEKPEKAPLEQGEWITLSGADSELSAILTPQTTPTPHGVVILVPDRGGHPDQPGVINPLRSRLPEFGWTTLALPPPPADQPGGLLDIGIRRLQVAIDYVQQQKLGTVVLAGHGLGATLAAAYLASQPQSPVAGLIAVGWYDPEGAEDRLRATEAIAASPVPVYDIYGGRDLRRVEQGAAERLLAARKANRNYRQKRIEGADHDHTGLGPALAQQVRGWLYATLIKPRSSP